jgi:hypothetical protein
MPELDVQPLRQALNAAYRRLGLIPTDVEVEALADAVQRANWRPIDIDVEPAAVKLREVAAEIERLTKGSTGRPFYESVISWIRVRAFHIDGLENPHPSPFEQAVQWLQETATGDEPAAGHARRLLDEVFEEPDHG